MDLYLTNVQCSVADLFILSTNSKTALKAGLPAENLILTRF